MKSILLIAGGSNQESLALEILKYGYKLILVDPYSEGPCLRLANVHIQCDTRYYLDIINTIVQRKIHIDGVTSDQSDASLISVSKVAEYFDLPHMPAITIKNCLNKFTQYNILEKSQVEIPFTKKISPDCLEENKLLLTHFFTERYSKAVIKPSDSQGSKGVQIVESIDELIKKLHYTSKETSCGEIIIQEYIQGPEYSLDAVIVNRKLTPLVIANKYHYLSNPCIDERNTFFNDVPKQLEEDIVETVSNAAKALNLDNTLIHAELMQETKTNRMCLIEISPRGGGGSISSKIVPYLTNFNANKFLISKCLGEKIDDPRLGFDSSERRFVVMRFLPELEFCFDNISIESPRHSILLHCELPSGAGEFRKIRDSRDRVGYFVIGNTDLNLLREDEDHMLDSIKFKKQNGS